jgi:centromere protein C
MSVISTPGSNDFPRGRKVTDDSYYEGSDDEDGEGGDDLVDSDEDGDDRDRSLLASARKRGVDYNDSDDDDDDDDDGGRRSRRATKGKRFAYWKNERPVYDKGQIVGVLTAEPTPRKKKSKLNGKGNGGAGGSRIAVVKEAKLPPVSLPKDLTFGDSESLDVWDDAKDQIKNERVVCSADTLPEPASLPITASRAKNRTAVGTAAQFFSVPGIPNVMSGWLTGALVLPPEAIKDAEGVGECAQVFFVVDCQDGALEVDYADPKEDTWQDELAQRTLLSKGDSFYIPPGNIYRLENHSKAKEASLCWTIIKPMDEEAIA